MRYTVTKNNRMLAFALMGVGLVSLIIGFAADPHRGWASLLVNGFYFMALALAATFFLAVQYVARAGWSVGVLRVMQAMGQYLPVPAIVIFVVILGSVLHLNHIYHWMDGELYKEFLPDGQPNPQYDHILSGKQGFLNVPFFLIRVMIYFAIWIGFTRMLRKESIQEDLDGNISHYHKSVKLSAIFIVLFAVTSSTSAWDFLMSIDAHWFSTLFGWYTFATMFVSALAMMTLLVIYLKRKGYLDVVNENHIHDLGKFVFAFSIFWTYLWFAQFMLYWYANLPEEVVYYQERWQNFKGLWVTNLVINFVFPILVLMARDSKRNFGILTVACIGVLVGHWVDIFVMVMPGTVGAHYGIGFAEIGALLALLGGFLWVVLNALSKAPLVPQKHPMLEESIHHHI